MVATAFGLGRLLGSANIGLLAAIVLATAPRFLMFSRRIIIDVHLAMFAGLTLLCFALAEAHPHRRKFYLVLMYLAAGFGVLTKGPDADALTGAVFLLYFALEHRLSDIRRMLIPVGFVIGILVVLPWYVVVRLFAASVSPDCVVTNTRWPVLPATAGQAEQANRFS